MEFLKRHYEKLVLASMLLIFIGALVYLVHVVKTINEVPEVHIKPAETDYDKQRRDQKAEIYRFAYLMTYGDNWRKAEPRAEKDANPKYASDLMHMFLSARCPHCKALIPYYCFQDSVCVRCNEKLKKPVEQKRVIINERSEDMDGDGIPNGVEEKFGLDPKDPADALYDKDNDGFSNLYEFKAGTLLDDPKSHPPMWHRLFLKDMRKIVLPVRLMAVNANSSKKKSDWVVQISNFDLRSNQKGRDIGMYAIGEEFKLDRRDYVLTDIDLRQTPVKEGNTEVIRDESVIRIRPKAQRDDPSSEVSMQVGREVFSPTLKAVLVDCGNVDRNPKGQEYIRDVGEEVVLGNRATGFVRYVIREINEKKQEVRISRRRGPIMPEPITKTGKIPEDQRIKGQSRGIERNLRN